METSPSAGSRSGTISLTNGVDSMGWPTYCIYHHLWLCLLSKWKYLPGFNCAWTGCKIQRETRNCRCGNFKQNTKRWSNSVCQAAKLENVDRRWFGSGAFFRLEKGHDPNSPIHVVQECCLQHFVFCSRCKNSTGADSSQNVRVMQILGGVQIYQLEVNTIEGRGGSPILSLWEAFGAPSPFKHLAQSTPAFCTSFLLNCFLYTNGVIFKHGSTETEAALENTSQLYNIHSSRRPMHNYTCNSGHHSPKNIYIILNIRNMPL